MTEQKPVAWTFESCAVQNTWRPYAQIGRPLPDPCRRNIRPLYEHPAPQPATDPAVEAARRKALRAILNALSAAPHSDDRRDLVLRFGVLRDLVGQPRMDASHSILGYDDGLLCEPVYDEETDLKVSAPMREPCVNTADLARKEATPPARLSVARLALIIRNRAGLCLCVIDTRTCAAIATAVHEAVYGKDGK